MKREAKSRLVRVEKARKLNQWHMVSPKPVKSRSETLALAMQEGRWKNRYSKHPENWFLIKRTGYTIFSVRRFQRTGRHMNVHRSNILFQGSKVYINIP